MTMTTEGPFLSTLLQHRYAMSAEIKRLQTDLDAINGVIKNALILAGVDAVEQDGYRAKMTTRTSSKLMPARLLEQGVSAAQIEAATVTSTYVELRVTKDKEKE